MRLLLPLLALFPLAAAAQDLGTYQITSGTIVPFGASNLTADGISFGIDGYPQPLYADGYNLGGETDFSVAFSPLYEIDWGMYAAMISSPSDLTAQGLSPLAPGLGVYAEETGSISTPLIDVTQAGIYSVPFTMSVDVYYAAPGATSPSGYINLVGNGELTASVVSFCAGSLTCPAYSVQSADYVFAPELDQAWLPSALSLLIGGLMVFRGRRRMDQAVGV